MSVRRWLILLGLGAAPAVAEAVVLRAVGLSSAMGLAPQAGAITPFGSFHDLRWIFVYHWSWASFLVELLAAIALRSGWAVLVTVVAWPRNEGRPPTPLLVKWSVAAHAVVVLLLAPWAAVAVAGSETSLSWFLFGEVLPFLVLGLVLTRAGVTPGWWRGCPTWRLAGVGLAAFLAATVASTVVGFAPGWWAVPVVAALGTVNGLLWRGVVLNRAPVTWRWARRVPVPLVVTGALAVSMLGAGRLAAFGTRMALQPIPAITGPGVSDVDVPVIYLAGYDSQYRSPPPTSGLHVEYFSYRGVDGNGDPLPYQPVQTHQSLARSATLLARQVSLAHLRTGRPVALIAQSEGTLVARAYLQLVRHPPVSAVALLSPLVRPARVYVPPAGADSGWGVGTGWLLRGMFAGVRDTDGPPIAADEPFMRSVLDHAVLYRDLMLCPVPGVRMVAFLPLADAAVVPPGWYAAIPVVELPGLHASELGRAQTQRSLLAFLTGRQVSDAPSVFYPVIQQAAAAWQAPALALRLNPVWHATGQPDAAFGQDGCAAHAGRP